MFEGRSLVVASMHGKDSVIAPIVQKELGVNCFVHSGFNSDLFGTFSGEVERVDDVMTVLRNKCLQAMELSNCDLSISSEGSFGQHPFIPFVTGDDELIMFLDKKNNIEIVAREVSVTTNFNGALVYSKGELVQFAERALFPSHALIIRENELSFKNIKKGIISWAELYKLFNELHFQNGFAYIETDMRAMHNPTRMAVIKEAALKLVRKIKSFCPQCSLPGFDVTSHRKGLKCSNCGMPTKSIFSHIYECKRCSYSVENKFPYGKYYEEPMFCDFCNP
jgi:hypothetical protein